MEDKIIMEEIVTSNESVGGPETRIGPGVACGAGCGGAGCAGGSLGLGCGAAFGGMSMGGIATWGVLTSRIDSIGYYLPMSGDSWLMGYMGGERWSEETAGQLYNKNYDARDFYVFAATGTSDYMETSMVRQTDAMQSYTDVFDFTNQGFSDGNIVFYNVPGSVHTYQDSYQYLYNGLQYFFIDRQ